MAVSKCPLCGGTQGHHDDDCANGSTVKRLAKEDDKVFADLWKMLNVTFGDIDAIVDGDN